MEKRLQAVFKGGVLEPLEDLRLGEMQQVTVTITDSAGAGQEAAGYFSPEDWAEAASDDVSLQDVRKALSTISGSLSEAVIAHRSER